MTAKKKPAKRQTKAKTSSPKKRALVKSRTSIKSTGRKKSAIKRKATRPSRKIRKTVEQKKSATVEMGFSAPRGAQARSGRQSGDLQGLSRAEQADSESVDELIEEGNPFEAEAVAGVEEADNADQREVHTHEVPEDDVPDEYLEKD
jgi:hypothetical protein